MTIRELVDILQGFSDQNKTVFVELWKTDSTPKEFRITSKEFEIKDLSDNNGHAQLNIYEEHDDAN